MNKDAVTDADVEPFRASQGGGGDGRMTGPLLRAGAERGGTEWTRGRDNPEDAPRTGVGVGGRVEMTGGPVALTQPSNGLLTQKRCRHGANLPHGGGTWTGTERGEQGPEGVSGL